MAQEYRRKGLKRGSRNEPRLFDGDDDMPDPRGSLRGERRNSSRPRPAKQRRRGFLSWLFRTFLVLGFWFGLASAAAFGALWLSLEKSGQFQIPEREPGVMILASDGSELVEQGTFFGDAVRLRELPSYVPNAVIAIEDRRFYGHYGVDPIGLSRAMFRNAVAGQLREGGSTLTQQLAKNLFLTHERTLARKAQEMVFAIWLETRFSKDEILQLYLNRVYFGGGANGIDKAARSFYGKSAYELSLMEAATLAGVLKAPTTYNPVRNPEEAASRARLVLNAMVEEGYITRKEQQAAISAPTVATPVAEANASLYAVDWISKQLPLFVKDRSKSLIVETTLDPVLQAQAEDALNARLDANMKKLAITQGAVVTLDRNGAIRALVGGRSYKRSQFNRATEAKRQPGSAFKAFVYLTALENGYDPDSVEVDEPITIGKWSPENYKRKYLGAVTLEQAYALSLNTVAAKLAQAVSPREVTSTAKRLGIASPLGTDASIALGTSEVTLLELTGAFTPFANGGRLVEPYIVRRILNSDGEVLYERTGDGLGQVVAGRQLASLNRMMRGVVSYGTGTKALLPGIDMGGKTGTSQDYRDAWFVGYTGQLVTGVWMGNDDNSPTNKVTGGSLPALVWHDYMAKAHEGLDVLPLPGADAQIATHDGVSADDAEAASEPSPAISQADPDETEKVLRPRRKKGLLATIFGLTEDDVMQGKRKKPEGNGLY